MQVSSNIVLFVSLEDTSDAQFRKEVIDSLTPLVQDTEESVRKAALNGIGEIITMTKDPQLCRDTIKTFTSQIKEASLDIRKTLLVHLTNIIRIEKTLIRDVFDVISQNIDSEASSFLVDLVEIDNKSDPQLAKDVLNLLSPHLQNSATLNHLKDLAKVTNDIQLGKDILNLITPFLQDPGAEIRGSAASNITEVAKIVSNHDIEFIQNIIQALTPLVKDSEPKIRATVGFIHIQELVELTDKRDAQLVRNTFDLAISLLQELDDDIQEKARKEMTEFVKKINQTSLITMKNDDKDEIMWLKGIVTSLASLSRIPCRDLRAAVSESLLQIGTFTNNTEVAKAAIAGLSQLLKTLDFEVNSPHSPARNIPKICADRDAQFLKDIIDFLTAFLKNSQGDTQIQALLAIRDVAKIKCEYLSKDVINKIFLPFVENSERRTISWGMFCIAGLLEANQDHTNIQFVKEIISKFVSFLQGPENGPRMSASRITKQILLFKKDKQLAQDVIDLLSPYFRDSNADVIQQAFNVLEGAFPAFFSDSEIFGKYLTHSSGDLRDRTTSFLFTYFQKYLNTFQRFDQLFQCPLSDLTPDMIMKELFNYDKSASSGEELQKEFDRLTEKVSRYLDKRQEEQLRSFLVSEINVIETLKGPGIIELAVVAIGYEKVIQDSSDRQKLIDLAKEVLNIQLKYLNEKGLTWINKNCEKLLSLSPETKVFYQKVYHKLLEDGEITHLEEQLLIKFINQGLTTSLTRSGEIIFEGKRYRLKGENIELALEKIAKTVIDQQQDILAMQYKQHEPIFKSTTKGGMRQAAADIKEIRSIVDSRHALKIGSWLLTRLKSLKFNSEIFILEQRSAFGDHVIYHWNQQKLIRFYPTDIPVLQEIFGSYIYGEAYQGEVFELTDKVGEELLGNPNMKPSGEGGKHKSKQIYFQQELLRQGSEDRHNAVEEELAKKLDNNRAVLQSKFKSLKLQESEKLIIEDYYEGFVSTFSSVYTSSQAIESGKLSIDDGEDFFSPVNLFIKLSSLAPFGIGNILSDGLEAAKSYIKSTTITNEAKFVKDFAIDAVELSELVSKIALNIISNKNQRRMILEAKDDDEEEPNSLVNRVKDLVMEKIEKLKNFAEKHTKMKNLFEKEVATSPAFRLGEKDANKIIKEWIDLKGSQPDLRPKPEEKQKLFTKMIIGEVAEAEEVAEVGKGNKVTPLSPNPQEIKSATKTGCCEIF